MAFVDTPTRAIVELTVLGEPAGRYQLEVHRTLEEDPSYVRVHLRDLTPAEFAAIFDNAAVGLAGQVQEAHQQIATLQQEVAQRDAAITAHLAVIAQYKAAADALAAVTAP